MPDHPSCDPAIVIGSALLHDVGIEISEEGHGFNNGKTQEEYGPPVAGDLLVSIGFFPDNIEIVKHVIGSQHSASRYDYPKLAVLKDAN
jgi:hypothetical protein